MGIDDARVIEAQEVRIASLEVALREAEARLARWSQPLADTEANKLYAQLVEAQTWMQREEHNGSIKHDPVYSTLYGRAAREIGRLHKIGENLPERKNAVAHDPVYSTLYGRATAEIERLTAMVRHAATEGVTFPPDTLSRVAGAEVIVVCPACAAEWKADNHDACPSCGLIPQGLN